MAVAVGSRCGSLTCCVLPCPGQVLRHTQELPGAWVKGQSAGGCRNNSSFPSNPKFWLRVLEPSEVYVTVLQRPRMREADGAGRARAPLGASRATWRWASALGQDYPAVGLHLWKVGAWGFLPGMGGGHRPAGTPSAQR